MSRPMLFCFSYTNFPPEERGQPSTRAVAAPAPAPVKHADAPQTRSNMYGLYAGLCLIALVVIPTLGLASVRIPLIPTGRNVFALANPSRLTCSYCVAVCGRQDQPHFPAWNLRGIPCRCPSCGFWCCLVHLRQSQQGLDRYLPVWQGAVSHRPQGSFGCHLVSAQDLRRIIPGQFSLVPGRLAMHAESRE
jgi:hypothetical protein